MAGRAQPPRDAKGVYRKRCRDLADELGFRREEIWTQFEWLAGCVEFESPWCDRAAAEDMAFRAVVGTFDKRGADGN
jgi:hypothetical protein